MAISRHYEELLYAALHIVTRDGSQVSQEEVDSLGPLLRVAAMHLGPLPGNELRTLLERLVREAPGVEGHRQFDQAVEGLRKFAGLGELTLYLGVAEADGVITDHERVPLRRMAEAWGIDPDRLTSLRLGADQPIGPSRIEEGALRKGLIEERGTKRVRVDRDALMLELPFMEMAAFLLGDFVDLSRPGYADEVLKELTNVFGPGDPVVRSRLYMSSRKEVADFDREELKSSAMALRLMDSCDEQLLRDVQAGLKRLTTTCSQYDSERAVLLDATREALGLEASEVTHVSLGVAELSEPLEEFAFLALFLAEKTDGDLAPAELSQIESSIAEVFDCGADAVSRARKQARARLATESGSTRAAFVASAKRLRDASAGKPEHASFMASCWNGIRSVALADGRQLASEEALLEDLRSEWLTSTAEQSHLNVAFALEVPAFRIAGPTDESGPDREEARADSSRGQRKDLALELVPPKFVIAPEEVQPPSAVHSGRKPVHIGGSSDSHVKRNWSPTALKAIEPVIQAPEGRLDLVPADRLADFIVDVVAVESPVHLVTLTDRLVKGAGLQRTGRRIQDAVGTAVRLAAKLGAVSLVDDFLWQGEPEPVAPRDRSGRPSWEKRPEFIAPEEFEGAVLHVLGTGPEMRDKAIKTAARSLGLRRVSTQIEAALQQASDRLERKGLLRDSGGIISSALG